MWQLRCSRTLALGETMLIRLVILDFDGTLTVLGPEFASFALAFLERVREKTKLGHESFAALRDELRELIHRHPHKYGWHGNHRHLAAAGPVDPNVELRAMCELAFKRTKTFRSNAAVEKELDTYFGVLNQSIKTHLHDETPALIHRLVAANFPSYVVTNSHPARVQKVLGEIHPAFYERVRGNARKNVIVPGFTVINKSMFHMPGLGRHMPLRRQPYYEAMNQIRLEHGLEWSEILVIGDNFELDLLLPLYLGATVCLIDHDRIPDYEREFIRKHPRANIVRSVEHALSLFPHLWS